MTDLDSPLPWETHRLRFDEGGNLTSPDGLEKLLERNRSDPRELIVLCHGWNNPYARAMKRYRALAGHLHALSPDKPRRLALLFWPSTAWVRGGEVGPELASATSPNAASTDDIDDDQTYKRLTGLPLVASLLDRSISRAEVRGLVSSVLHADEAPCDEAPGVTLDVDRLVDVWTGVAAAQSVAVSNSSEYQMGGLAPPEMGGDSDTVDPRQILRLLTMFKMKDRAGRVGRAGVAAMLRRLADSASAPPILVGHSFGAKVALAALAANAGAGRPVAAGALLLQAAVSRHCFDHEIPDTGRPGGYRDALLAVEHRVLATHSVRDAELRRYFHVVARRPSDLGEIGYAGDEQDPPLYGALGGFGPADGAGAESTDPLSVGQVYSRHGSPLLSIRASDVISDHGDIANADTAWMLESISRMSD